MTYRAPGPADVGWEVLDLLFTWERELERRLMARRHLDSDGQTAQWMDREKERRT